MIAISKFKLSFYTMVFTSQNQPSHIQDAINPLYTHNNNAKIQAQQTKLAYVIQDPTAHESKYLHIANIFLH